MCVYIWSRDGFRKRFSRAFVSRGTPMAENWRATKGPSSLAAPLLAYTRAKGIPQVPRRLVERKRPDRYVWRLVLFIFIAVHVHAAKALAPTFSYFHTHLGGGGGGTKYRYDFFLSLRSRKKKLETPLISLRSHCKRFPRFQPRRIRVNGLIFFLPSFLPSFDLQKG